VCIIAERDGAAGARRNASHVKVAGVPPARERGQKLLRARVSDVF
jgi:hypothetical protein